jgi:diphthamide synthase (EF-2-diphthine--ammonia ligase)
MPVVKLPQREVLRRLLDTGKLVPSDAKLVRRAYDDLVAGKIAALSFEQRVHMERLCRRCGVALTEITRSDSKKKAQLEQKRAVADFDAMPRPKRPPGR